MSTDQPQASIKTHSVSEKEEDPQIPFSKDTPVTTYETDHTVGSLLDACLAAKGPMRNRR